MPVVSAPGITMPTLKPKGLPGAGTPQRVGRPVNVGLFDLTLRSEAISRWPRANQRKF
jgi:hypothetical protein